MMKVLLVSIDFAPNHGGVAAYWLRVCRTLVGSELAVLTNIAAAPKAGLPQQIVVRPLLSHWFYPRWLRGVFDIWRTCRQLQCRQIIAAQLLPVGSMAYILHRLTGIPYVVQVYGMDLALAMRHPRKKRLARRILRSAHAVIANSQATARLAKECDGEDLNIQVVYPIPEISQADVKVMDHLRAKYHLSGQRIILTLGRLVERKGQDKVIEAMPAIRAQVPDAVYVIVGDGSDAGRLKTLAKEQGEAIVFTGSVDEAERNAWLSICDVFAMPSRTLPGDVEGFGMVYLEAAAFGKPVVAANSGGAGEAVEDGKTGLLVEPTSADAIAGAITRLLLNPAEAQALGTEGKRQMQTKWQWNEQIERFKQALL
ncbi:MAG: glycosyltransferase family 4 protein [Parcubacteria group bacterium]|nr:glycosyltransferase family 4 protein [Parcubacteria group bacterium]